MTMTVTVGSKVHQSLRLAPVDDDGVSRHDEEFILNGANHSEQKDGYGITRGVLASAFHSWWEHAKQVSPTLAAAVKIVDEDVLHKEPPDFKAEAERSDEEKAAISQASEDKAAADEDDEKTDPDDSAGPGDTDGPTAASEDDTGPETDPGAAQADAGVPPQNPVLPAESVEAVNQHPEPEPGTEGTEHVTGVAVGHVEQQPEPERKPEE